MGMNTPLYMMAVNFGIAQKAKTKKFQQALQKSIISLLMIGMRLLDVIILYQSLKSTPEPDAFATYAIEDGDGGYVSASVSEDDFVEAMGYETIEDYQDEDYDKFLWTDKGVNVLETLARKKHLL